MGYRLRIGKINKKASIAYRRAPSEEIVKDLAKLKEEDGVYRSLPEYVELYELGKYVDYSEGTEPFFKHFELEDNHFCVASKGWLLNVIEEYRTNVHAWYTILSHALVEEPPTEGCEKLEGTNTLTVNNEWESDGLKPYFPAAELYHHLRKRVTLWSGKFAKPYIEKDGARYITNDWSYEYSVFNLVHILHTFDWENDYLIYSGW